MLELETELRGRHLVSVPEAWGQSMVAHAFNPGTQESRGRRSLTLRPVWSTEQVSGQRYKKKKEKRRKREKHVWGKNSFFTRVRYYILKLSAYDLFKFFFWCVVMNV